MSEKTLMQQQIGALLAERRGYYPVCSTCGEDLIPHDGELCGACAKSELVAAEERGRRAGIEEGFRRGVENAAQWLKVSEPLRLAMHRALSDRVDLAPRDSGKEDRK